MHSFLNTSKRPSVMCRSQPSGDFQERLRSIVNRIGDERKRYEERRLNNFREFYTSLQQIAEEEFKFVKDIVDVKCNVVSKKTEKKESLEDVYDE